ncbi:MAG: hypothetical protein AAB074_04485 [Planctomycetota bacterium]
MGAVVGVAGLRWATAELTDAAGEVCAVAASELGDWEIEKLLAQSIRVASCVALGIDASGPGEAEERLSEARSAAAALAARVHIAVNRGTIEEATGLQVRTKIRAVVDQIDMVRYRRRRAA